MILKGKIEELFEKFSCEKISNGEKFRAKKMEANKEQSITAPKEIRWLNVK